MSNQISKRQRVKQWCVTTKFTHAIMCVIGFFRLIDQQQLNSRPWRPLRMNSWTQGPTLHPIMTLTIPEEHLTPKIRLLRLVVGHCLQLQPKESTTIQGTTHQQGMKYEMLQYVLSCWYSRQTKVDVRRTDDEKSL